MATRDKPLVWQHGQVKSPPFSKAARLEAGYMLRQLQKGVKLSLPHSRPMPVIGRRCHELRISDDTVTWRIIYRLDEDAVVIAEVFAKKTQTTPKSVIETCQKRLADYDSAAEGGEEK